MAVAHAGAIHLIVRQLLVALLTRWRQTRPSYNAGSAQVSAEAQAGAFAIVPHLVVRWRLPARHKPCGPSPSVCGFPFQRLVLPAVMRQQRRGGVAGGIIVRQRQYGDVADGDLTEASNGNMVAWVATSAVSCILARLLVGSLEVKVKT